MDLKQELINRALRVLQDPRVARALQDPRVMQGLMQALQLSAKARQNLDASVRAMAKGLNLATDADVEELRRTVERLQAELDAQRPLADGG